ncbi:predicted protein [Naegleria gruberi]|uniref:Predicted protein n=1 Tax=Naegleria gruberi TaxID=5762 RepID=D2VFS9_NAEGR|nr:uncharacterized protein NAEGRDRAFT_67730 [Naegleria gruberi]EFC44525.1 predicted protein [Naegleria gruberi]|eukprot:XP_002677269.1 predicted protein [Naegleria gruberi strain NEG-M]
MTTTNQANLIDHRSFFSSHSSQKKLGENQKLRLLGIIDKNIEQLKILNNYIYPIKYRESVYEQILQKGPEFNQFAIFNDIPVGSFSCRVDSCEGNPSIYLMLLGVLPKYRKLGIGRELISKVFEICKKFSIDRCHLHVQCTNESAIQFYEKIGFKNIKKLENFYINDRLPENECKDCYLMEIVLQ